MSAVSLAEVMNQSGIEHEYRVETDLNSVTVDGTAYRISEKKPVHLLIKSPGERKITFRTDFDIELEVPCDRCLEPVKVRIDADESFDIQFDESGNQITGEDIDEYGFINGYDLDIDRLVIEEVMIGFPMKVLCDEECRGLCPICGANLNKHECGCDRQVLDPRMSIIRDIFRQQGSPSDKDS